MWAGGGGCGASSQVGRALRLQGPVLLQREGLVACKPGYVPTWVKGLPTGAEGIAGKAILPELPAPDRAPTALSHMPTPWQ